MSDYHLIGGKGPVRRALTMDEKGEITVHEQSDITQVLEDIKTVQNNTTRKLNYVDGSQKGMVHVGHIPNIVISMWKNMYGVDVYDQDHSEAVLKLLDDPEWAALRVGGGRLT
jgi:hypothetical protein